MEPWQVLSIRNKVDRGEMIIKWVWGSSLLFRASKSSKCWWLNRLIVFFCEFTTIYKKINLLIIVYFCLSLVRFGWFYGTSSIVGYLIPNPVYQYVLNIYDFSTEVNKVKWFQVLLCTTSNSFKYQSFFTHS